MARKKAPGQRSNIALLMSSIWAILALFIIIVGHLVIVLLAYGIFTGSQDAMAHLQSFLPVLSEAMLYGLAAAAIATDIWISISQKRAYEKQFER